jgi:hypothetical protein
MPSPHTSDADAKTVDFKHPNGDIDHPPIPASPTPRQRYLSKIGLKRDPFLVQPVAELELASSGYSLLGSEAEGQPAVPSFFDYYATPPVPLPDGQNLLQLLRHPGLALVYGQRGAGKTTLRLNLAAEVRLTPEHTLAVSHVFSEDIPAPRAAEVTEGYWNRLAQTLAIDLFIQIIEDFNPLDPAPTSAQIIALRDVVSIGGPPLKQLAKRLLKDPEPQGLLGFGELWPQVGRPAMERPAVRYVARPPQLTALLQAAIGTKFLIAPPRGHTALLTGLHAAKEWEFKQILMLIDGVDTGERGQTDMLALLHPLLDELGDLYERGVSLKLFLPSELQPGVSARLAEARLPKPPFNVRIEWDEGSLRALVRGRFRAAGSYRQGFDDLAGPNLQGKLDDLLIESAAGSPRRLLFTINSLINAHTARDPSGDDPFIHPADWELMRAMWGHEPPPPPALTRP